MKRDLQQSDGPKDKGRGDKGVKTTGYCSRLMRGRIPYSRLVFIIPRWPLFKCYLTLSRQRRQNPLLPSLFTPPLPLIPRVNSLLLLVVPPSLLPVSTETLLETGVSLQSVLLLKAHGRSVRQESPGSQCYC